MLGVVGATSTTVSTATGDLISLLAILDPVGTNAVLLADFFFNIANGNSSLSLVSKGFNTEFARGFDTGASTGGASTTKASSII